MDMNSYNMAMSILSSFGNSSVYRLKHTFSSISKKSLDASTRIQNIFSTESSYKVYRELLSRSSPPAIPFLGVYLTDLTFIEEGNKDKINGLINFSKRKLEYGVIIQLMKYQIPNHHFKLLPKFTTFFKSIPLLNEKDLYTLSLHIEPRNSKKKDLK
eukprot:TRINITY_DN2555_c0_g1_i1.p1 TRINITY_DN2555_c0_g1~~TRINITY_DN2555_c0_g1_i1.p1  ORF type:complete len:157 (+),score=21.49 TRINITY_DN2555_c0_g1_i1:361-831(+)